MFNSRFFSLYSIYLCSYSRFVLNSGGACACLSVFECSSSVFLTQFCKYFFFVNSRRRSQNIADVKILGENQEWVDVITNYRSLKIYDPHTYLYPHT